MFFLQIKENTNFTFAVIKGISYIFKHIQQSHVYGMVVSEGSLISIHHITFVHKTQQKKSLPALAMDWSALKTLSLWESADDNFEQLDLSTTSLIIAQVLGSFLFAIIKDWQ